MRGKAHLNRATSTPSTSVSSMSQASSSNTTTEGSFTKKHVNNIIETILPPEMCIVNREAVKTITFLPTPNSYVLNISKEETTQSLKSLSVKSADGSIVNLNLFQAAYLHLYYHYEATYDTIYYILYYIMNFI